MSMLLNAMLVSAMLVCSMPGKYQVHINAAECYASEFNAEQVLAGILVSS